MHDRWSTASVALHWLGAAFIIGLAAAGFVMSDMPPASASRLLLSRMHTVGGALLMLLTVGRLLTRLRQPALEPLPLSDMHRKGVQAVHGLLYAVTFLVGLSGFVTGATSAWPDYLQGRLAEAPALGELASREAHEALAVSLLALVALHVGGVMVEQVRRGGALRRMLPFVT